MFCVFIRKLDEDSKTSYFLGKTIKCLKTLLIIIALWKGNMEHEKKGNKQKAEVLKGHLKISKKKRITKKIHLKDRL